MPSNANSLSDLLAEVFRRGGMKRGVKRAEAVLLWPQVAGREVARFTEAKSLQDGVLLIEVSDSETATHLTLQRQRFVHAYRGRFGVKDVRDLRFLVGRPRSPEPTPPPPPTSLPDPKALEKMRRELGALELPEELAKPTLQAAEAMLAYRARRRAEGWRPCPICSTLTQGGERCDACERYCRDARVQRGSHTLAVNPDSPTPLLSDDEREAARHLARAYLSEKLQELLPQVLANPAFKPHLESAARCLLAHTLRKPLAEITEDDLDRLEPRIARALGRWR